MIRFKSYLTEETHPEWEEVQLAMKLKQIPKFSRKEFTKKMSTGKPVSRKNFSGIENTDAENITSLQKARNLFKKYGKGSSDDFNNLVQAVKEKKTPPIIIYREDNREYLVGGNTRAMIATALRIRHAVRYLSK